MHNQRSQHGRQHQLSQQQQHEQQHGLAPPGRPQPGPARENLPEALLLQRLQQFSLELHNWYSRSQAELNAVHRRVHERISAIRQQVLLANPDAVPARGGRGGGGGGGDDERGGTAAGAASVADMSGGSGERGGSEPRPDMSTAAALLLSTPPRKPLSGGGDNAEDLEGDWGLLRRTALSTPPSAAAQQQQRGSHNHHGGGGLLLPEITPTGSPQSSDKVPLEMLLSRIAAGSNSPPLNFDSIYEQLAAADPSGSSPLGSGSGGLFHDPEHLAGAPQQHHHHQQQQAEGKQSQGSAACIPVDLLLRAEGQVATRALRVVASESGRPTVVTGSGSAGDDGTSAASATAAAAADGDGDDGPEALGIDPDAKCEVLVEFKRKRVLQYHSDCFVAPGEYVVVGGDRGEDLGLVIFAWGEGRDGKVKAIGLSGSTLARSIGLGTGKVVRLAERYEVAQLHGMQTELERRAVEVCQLRVQELGIPMRIVDSEYQFDKKKLTFFYEAARRQDFRELVRDLFKTFRARIWMELVEA